MTTTFRKTSVCLPDLLHSYSSRQLLLFKFPLPQLKLSFLLSWEHRNNQRSSLSASPPASALFSSHKYLAMLLTTADPSAGAPDLIFFHLLVNIILTTPFLLFCNRQSFLGWSFWKDGIFFISFSSLLNPTGRYNFLCFICRKDFLQENSS